MIENLDAGYPTNEQQYQSDTVDSAPVPFSPSVIVKALLEAEDPEFSPSEGSLAQPPEPVHQPFMLMRPIWRNNSVAYLFVD